MGANAHMRPKTAALNTHPELRIDAKGSRFTRLLSE